MNIKKTIIIILLALVAMSADAQSLNKDVERLQYVYALKVVINDSIWSGFADKQYDVPLLYYGDTCCYVVNPTEKFLAKSAVWSRRVRLFQMSLQSTNGLRW